jgi:predicted DNA-binding transcriptional regulator YafY
VEFIADEGEAFVPIYSLSWRDGGWRHLESPVPIRPPLELTVEALAESTRCLEATSDPPLTDAQLREERAGYLREAQAAARALRARAAAAPPAWNPGTGRADLDELLWFRYVQTDGRPA